VVEEIVEPVKKNNRDEKIVTILNYVIIALVVAFVIVCIMIIYQIFF
jgi:predicted nucleic acid-binding Zn ribbon protein